MHPLVKAALVVAGAAAVYYTVDAITTTNPQRRKTDLRDLRIIGAGANVIKAL